MAPLDAAVALAEVDAVALAVGEHLDLDVPRRADVLLDVHGAVAERRLGLGLSLTHRGRQLGGLLDDADALAAAAGGRLDHHRQADVGGRRPRPRRRLSMMPSEPGVTGTPAAVIVVRAAALSPMRSMRLRRWPDELDAVLAAERAELGALGEEPVAGVDGLGAGLQGRLDEGRHHEVALRRRRRADADGLVGEPHVQAVLVGLGVDGDRPHAELLAGADDADGDLAAIGDEDLAEHARSLPTVAGL